jgi:hypothetical protein
MSRSTSGYRISITFPNIFLISQEVNMETSMKPIYIEFWLDDKRHACRRGIGRFPHPESDAAPASGDRVILTDGVYVVKERIWDFASEDSSNQGLRLVIEKA